MESETLFWFFVAFSISATAYIGYLLQENNSIKKRVEREESDRQMARLYDHIDRVEADILLRIKNSSDIQNRKNNEKNKDSDSAMNEIYHSLTVLEDKVAALEVTCNKGQLNNIDEEIIL
jgi:subtilase family serine protease